MKKQAYRHGEIVLLKIDKLPIEEKDIINVLCPRIK